MTNVIAKQSQSIIIPVTGDTMMDSNSLASCDKVRLSLDHSTTDSAAITTTFLDIGIRHAGLEV